MLEKTLKLLFRTQDTQRIALVLLTEIRDRQNTENPYTSDEYHELCKKHNFSEQSYQNVLNTLREHELLIKTGGHHGGRYDINYSFVSRFASELFEFLGAKYKKEDKKEVL